MRRAASQSTPRRAPAGTLADERHRLEVLYGVTRRLAAVHATDDILALIVNEATRLLGAEAAGLRLLEGDELVMRAETERAKAIGFRPRLRKGESLSGLVVARGEPVVVEDLAKDTHYDPAHKQAALDQGFHGFLGIPLRAHDRVIGVLNVFTTRRRRFEPDEISLLTAFADQASLAIDKDRLLRQATDRAARLRRLVRLNQVVFSSLNTHEVLGAIASAAADLMDAPIVSIWSADETRQTVELRALSDETKRADYPASARRFGEGGAGWVALHRRPLDVPDVSTDGRVAAGKWFAAHGLSSVFAQPILFHDALLGVVALYGRAPFRFDADAQELLESFTAQAAVAMRNARLYEDLRLAHERLERRTRDLDLLSRVSEMLQACVAEHEAYTVVGRFMSQCFPDEAGGVFTTSASRNVVEAQAVWGAGPAATTVFRPEDCWALRRGRPHRVDAAGSALRCAHQPEPGPAASLCIPLMAQGESLGLLYLSAPSGAAGWTEAKEALGLAIGDQLGLAVANLKLRDTLRSQSIRDPLTGLFNRRYMEETLERELRRAERNRTSLAVCMLDLDHFKRFNDTFGHEAGDILLRELGHLLGAGVRQGDVVCRYGGEEFVLVLPDVGEDTVRQRAEELRSEVKRLHVAYRGQSIGSVTVSIGLALFPKHAGTVEDLVKAADTALYRAKNAGRDQVVVAG
jgi:diguanylate cyclase (GGDEF)-like protein